jgi:hypothetical protein
MKTVIPTTMPLSKAQIDFFTECYSDWLSSFDTTISHLINMDVETTDILPKALVTSLIDLQLEIQKAGFGAK